MAISKQKSTLSLTFDEPFADNSREQIVVNDLLTERMLP
jgi:hypothetical protein